MLDPQTVNAEKLEDGIHINNDIKLANYSQHHEMKTRIILMLLLQSFSHGKVLDQR